MLFAHTIYSFPSSDVDGNITHEKAVLLLGLGLEVREFVT